MAKPKKKSRSFLSPKIKRGAVVGVLLILMQGVYISYFSPTEITLSTVAAIDQSAMKKMMGGNADLGRISLLKIQLAISDYQSKHQGTPPAKLDELVPEYFDRLPLDFATGKPFDYRVEAKKFFIGTQKSKENVKGSPEEEQKQQLLAALTRDVNQIPPYDATGKRDPFKPINLAPDSEKRGETSPLESAALSSYSYTAYLAYGSEPKGIVENATGRGTTVSKGMKIGRNGGEVVEIKPDKILVVESEVDFAGERKSKTIELKLGIKGNNSE